LHMIRPTTSVIASGLILLTAGCSQPPERSTVQLHYLGHAAFLVTFPNGLTVLTDYGESRAYGLDSPVFDLGEVRPDIVTLSHDHADHAGGELPAGVGRLVTDGRSYEARGLRATAIPTFERSLDAPDNSSYLFEYDGLKLLHLGDCQALMLSVSEPAVQARIRQLYPHSYDLVLLPIGFTRDILAEAAQFVKLLDARRVVPMHYWSPQDRDAFLAQLEGATDSRGSRYVVRSHPEAGLELYWGDTADSGTVELMGLTPGPAQRQDRGP
jgi:L-ascorbate metabolism protein UlaG (beta-lactamase superfamily)